MESEAAAPRASAELTATIRQVREGQLVAQAKSGVKEAADELVRRYWADAYKGAFLILRNQEDAEDVTQEAFVSALNSMPRFKLGRPFQPWLRRIVSNKALDLIRSNRRRRSRDAALATEFDLTSAEPVAGLSVSDPALLEAVANLPFEQRVVVVLHAIFDMRTGEIAKALELPRGTVASRLHRALERLQTIYGGNDE